MTEDAQEMLTLLIEHELAMSRLYDLYALRFSARQGFWQRLASEERGHADRLVSLQHRPEVELWLNEGVNLRAVAVRSSIQYLEEHAQRARDGVLNLLQALSIARDIEHALIEKLTVLPQTGVYGEIGLVLAALRAETESHRVRIDEALDEERRLGV